MRLLMAGLSTGIGSLPYLEAQPALELVKKYLPVIPHWPQLPRRTTAEGFVQQFLGALTATGVLATEGKPRFFNDRDDWAERLTAFYTLCMSAEEGDEAALAAFAPKEESASGFFAFWEAVRAGEFPEAVVHKGQVVGPLTVGFQLTDAGGRPAYYDPELRELIVKNLSLAARWQAERLKFFGRPVVLFIDEPGVSVYGQSTYITVTREQIMTDMGEIVNSIKATGAIAGVHSCAGVDWSLLLSLNIDILSFDAYGYFNSLLPYRSELTGFLGRGGLLAWGIVPTSDAAWEESVESLTVRLKSYWDELASRGVSRELLARQWVISPSCGAGLLSEALTERIYAFSAAVADGLRAEGGWNPA